MLLEKRQGLLKPWSFEREDYDYLRDLLRPVVVPVASAANPSSDPESFAVTQSALHHVTLPWRPSYRCERSIRCYPVARLALWEVSE
jgi:hypothetical protein